MIDDYLAERLTADERKRFDQHYLASPLHRHRVATARHLQSAAELHPAKAVAARQEVTREATPSRTSLASIIRSLFDQPLPLKVAFATFLVAIAIGGAWLMRAGLATQSVEPPANVAILPPAPRTDPPAPKAPAPSPVLLAISLSPAGVRGAENSPPVTIPPGTDRVVVNLESDGRPHTVTKTRAVVHTVSGRETWRGPATAEPPTRAPVFARIEVPADRLAPDDYIVTLFEIPDAGPKSRVSATSCAFGLADLPIVTKKAVGRKRSWQLPT